jgi:hypothetical protein
VKQSTLKASPPLAPPSATPWAIPTHQPNKISIVYDEVKLPTSTRPQSTNIQERNKLIVLAVIIVLSVLIILSLIVFFIVHLFIH